MGIFTGGKSVAINSPRHLTLRHARRSVALNKVKRGLLAAEEAPQPVLKPGEEKLNSFWAPSLEAGPIHTIEATQTIISPNQGDNDLVLNSVQKFYVDAPQFSLPEGSVYSMYPPSGYPEDHRILPHVVLSDPHLPWERSGSPKDDNKQDNRNKVPWTILVTFTQEELRLAPGALGKDFKQTSTLAVSMTVEELLGVSDIGTPVETLIDPDAPDDDPEQKKIKASKGDFIFIAPDLFKSLFSTFDSQNKQHVPQSPDTAIYKYLSHVRNINTTGMAVAGVEDVGIFAVVVGCRSGPLNNETPISVCTHLISIEGVEAMEGFPDDKKFVGLCSLHSWNHTTMPPGMLNAHDAFVSLGHTLNVLRAPDPVIQRLLESPKNLSSPVATRLSQRLQDGYSLVKYRVQTGEETVAMYRGPFTPNVVQHKEGLDKCSNSGLDLQILDREVGIMDISYSAAWQLGRTLALGDQNYAAALARLRTAVQASAMKECKIDAVRFAGDPWGFRRRSEILRDLKRTVDRLDRVHLGDSQDPPGEHVPVFLPGPPKQRWRRPRLNRRQYPYLGFSDRKIANEYPVHAKRAIQELAAAWDGSIYDETNDPVSTDWMIVLAWVMNLMFLSGVPAHYLISDPSHLEHESLRFFYIDPNWVDALVDGALSLANHMEEDRDRVAIKEAINNYIRHKSEHQTHTPQIPEYGFYLRSDLVTMFPDLKVTTLPEPTPKGALPERAPLLRHEIVADGVMLGLLDRQPGSDDFTGLRFTQPPHQQRFAVGFHLTQDNVSIDIRRQYTVSQADRERDEDRHEALKPPIEKRCSDDDNWFIWSTTPGTGIADLRMLRLPYFAEEQRRLLQEKMPTFIDDQGVTRRFFDDDTPNSALLAMQLNDPVYDFTINISDEQAKERLASLHSQSLLGRKPKDLRTLHMLAKSRIKPLFDSKDDENETVPSDEDAAPHGPATGSHHPSGASLYQRHPQYTPATHVLKDNCAPHAGSLPAYAPLRPEMRPPTWHRHPPGRHDVIPPPLAKQALSHPTMPERLASRKARDSSSSSSNNSPPSGPPKFACSVYTPGKAEIHMARDDDAVVPQDLIFSVLVSNTEHSDWRLVEFDIVVPLGPADPDSHRLTARYDGPGARMLSNLRFNVLPSLSHGDGGGGNKYLVLRLLPRSAKGWIDVKTVEEMSFLLCLADVNQFPDSSTYLTLYTAAYYTQMYREEPREDRFTVEIDN
ncbi:hypothetical protein ANO14919_135950 [Xylariales sp. No.14919]|nr:hypothetical protein ANO14919_135950 [Xylariales sp. No.14919]